MLAPDPLYKVLTIRKIIPETIDFKTFVFTSDMAIPYESGQFLTLVQNHDQADKEVRRSYSIVSSPALEEPLSIGVKRLPNGFLSRKLIDQARIGDRLRTTGAGGFFKLPENISAVNSLFFFAAGSGITPVYSLIKTVLYSFVHVRIVLVYSNRSPESAAYIDQLIGLKGEFDFRFHIEFLFSISPDLTRARLTRDSLLLLLHTHGYDSASYFYVCGPAVYMRMVKYTLIEHGIPKASIRKEDFIPDSPALLPNLPPDKNSYEVIIGFRTDQYRFKVNYPDSILQAAKKENISLPYSCETGRCGSCAARSLNGRVWLSRNEVLTDDDLAGGLTLTCVGHPVGGDVQLLIN